jgi:superfamily II DNA or RNA helicase
MKQKFKGWKRVADCLHRYSTDTQKAERLNDGQRASLCAIAERLPNNGIIIADEVGMGKTRIAVEVVRAVIESGGRVAILVPPGLGYQWQAELRGGNVEVQPILRSLWTYLNAWELEQIELQQPWFQQNVVMISHNWRLDTHTSNAEKLSVNYWRLALLPEIYAHWRKRFRCSYPRDYCKQQSEFLIADENRQQSQKLKVLHAAKSICAAISDDKSCPAWQLLNDLVENTTWSEVSKPKEYDDNDNFRLLLERVVGLGLGVFDLIIVDEAHKNRGIDSSLSRLLNNILLRSAKTRCLAMTATPVELEIGQWKNTLSRIGVEGRNWEIIEQAIQHYDIAVKQVRKIWSSSKEARDQYRVAASEFQKTLSPYLLRRDKREDSTVIRYTEYSKLPFESYRKESEINVDIVKLPLKWKKAVCAAEALSVVSELDESSTKRLRLTIGNGHGIATLLDQVKHHEDDKCQEEHDEDQYSSSPEMNIDDKRKDRVEWWKNNIKTAFAKEDALLFDHPAILAAVHSIEEANQQGEKVLVFGRFTLPLKALVDLLNAREMLRQIEKDRPWPHSKVHDGEWPAVYAAHRQLNSKLNLDSLDSILKKQSKKLEIFRKNLREDLVKNLKQGFKEIGVNYRYCELVAKLEDSIHDHDKYSNESHPLILISRAISDELLDDELEPIDIARRFIQVIEAVTDQDENNLDDEAFNESQIASLWNQLTKRLEDEYSRNQSGFARLMYGDTKPHSRRMIQLAFNRKNSFPKVLVAQSIVGREGLNLHEACRIVVLLHPEWNPGVVEQQIGRVDRVGSHWGIKLDEAIKLGKKAEELPRIEVRPVIFSGTYDEHNWTVLRERWDDLRAQLHGIVVPARLKLEDPDEQKIVDELSEAAPKFSYCGLE